MIEPVAAQIRTVLGPLIYTEEYDSLEQTCLNLLRQADKTLATAESCTGGYIAKRMTDLPGSSAVFVGGVVAYTVPVKEQLLGVPAGLIERCGVVSVEVAAAMAEGVRARLGSSFGIGVTGLAGPDGDGSNRPVGLVHVALSNGANTWVRAIQQTGERERVRYIAGHHAFDMLRRVLTGLPVEWQ